MWERGALLTKLEMDVVTLAGDEVVAVDWAWAAALGVVGYTTTSTRMQECLAVML